MGLNGRRSTGLEPSPLTFQHRRLKPIARIVLQPIYPILSRSMHTLILSRRECRSTNEANNLNDRKRTRRGWNSLSNRNETAMRASTWNYVYDDNRFVTIVSFHDRSYISLIGEQFISRKDFSNERAATGSLSISRTNLFE